MVDAKNHSGLVQRREVGGFLKVDMRLYVGGRDCSKAIDGLDWQVDSEIKMLNDNSISVLGAVCFTDAEWELIRQIVHIATYIRLRTKRTCKEDRRTRSSQYGSDPKSRYPFFACSTAKILT